jgi:hypothetical protein
MGCAQSADAAEAAPPPTGISDERRQEAIREDKRYSDFVVPEAVLIDTAKCVRHALQIDLHIHQRICTL